MKYGGSAMMGLSQGLQTGLDWGMKMNQIKYEVAQKKKLDDEQEALNQTWADFGQNMSKLYDSGTLSDLDMKEMTMITLQLPQALQQQAMQTMNFLKQGQKEEYEKSLKDFEMTLEFIKQTGAQGDYTSLKKLLDEDQIKIIDAVLDTYKSLPEQSQMEVYSSVEALRQVHGENAPFEWNSNAGGYVPKYETGKEPTPLSQKDLLAINLYEQGKVSFDGFLKYMGMQTTPATPEKKSALQEKIDTAIQLGASQEEIKNMVIGGGAKSSAMTTPTAIENIREEIIEADTLEDAQRIANNYQTKYGDTSSLGMPDVKQEWTQDKVEYITNLKSDIEKLVNEQGWLGNASEKTILPNGKEATKEEAYRQLRDEYMAYLKKLEKAGVDISQFPKLKPLSEIEKVGFIEGATTGGGVGRGQFKSIYY